MYNYTMFEDMFSQYFGVCLCNFYKIFEAKLIQYCQTLGLVLRLRVDFVLPLSQEQQEEQQEPLTKIHQWGVYNKAEI